MLWKFSYGDIDSKTSTIYGYADFSTNEIRVNTKHHPKARQNTAVLHEILHAYYGRKPSEKGHQHIVELATELAPLLTKIRKYKIKYPVSMKDEDGLISISGDPKGKIKTEKELIAEYIRWFAYFMKINVTEQDIKVYTNLLYELHSNPRPKQMNIPRRNIDVIR